MDNANHAVSRFREGFNCSQAVVSSYAEGFGVSGETALKVAAGFGGGMHLGQICGAVTGAFMVIGLKYGATRAEDKDAKKKTYEVVGEFAEKFKARNGSFMCRELLGCDISTPEGAKIAQEKNLFASLCPKLVQDAAQILEEIL